MAPKGKSKSKPLQAAVGQFLERVAHVNALHPEADNKKLFYRTYCIGHLYRPDKYLVCHFCLKELPGSLPKYVKHDEMVRHCRNYHPKAKFECDYDKCSVQFEYAEEKEDHHHYVHA